MIAVDTVTEEVPTFEAANRAIAIGTKIGEGAYRAVYRLGDSKWVYKVNHEGPSSNGDNAKEYATYCSIRDAVINLPENVRIPAMYLFDDDILAAEYVEGYHPDQWCSARYGDHSQKCVDNESCWSTRLKDVPLRDMHPLNIRITAEDTIYIVDLGHGVGF